MVDIIAAAAAHALLWSAKAKACAILLRVLSELNLSVLIAGSWVTPRSKLTAQRAVHRCTHWCWAVSESRVCESAYAMGVFRSGSHAAGVGGMRELVSCICLLSWLMVSCFQVPTTSKTFHKCTTTTCHLSPPGVCVCRVYGDTRSVYSEYRIAKAYIARALLIIDLV